MQMEVANWVPAAKGCGEGLFLHKICLVESHQKRLRERSWLGEILDKLLENDLFTDLQLHEERRINPMLSLGTTLTILCNNSNNSISVALPTSSTVYAFWAWQAWEFKHCFPHRASWNQRMSGLDDLGARAIIKSWKKFCSNKDFITVNKGLWGDRIICKCLKTHIKEGKKWLGIVQGNNSQKQF